MTSYRTTDATRDDADLPRKIALLFGVVFLLVGIAGFIPGITTHYGDMKFAGHMSGAKLLGIFMVSVLHNLIHLAFGVVGILVSRRSSYASARYLLVGGIIYAVVWIYGLAVGDDSSSNFVPLNSADNWLHFLLALAMIVLGLISLRRPRTVAAR
jgi:arginine exporter protein ArgO